MIEYINPTQGETTYGRIVRWTSLKGGVQSVRINGCATAEEAKREAYKVALWGRRNPWTPRRWWQFWRYADTPNPSQEFLESI